MQEELREWLVNYYDRCVAFGSVCIYNDWEYIVDNNTIIATNYLGKEKTSLRIDDWIECLANELFKNTKIKNIDLNKVKYIGDSTFANSEVVVVNGPELLWAGEESFYKCLKLEVVELNKLRKIEVDTFRGCDKLRMINCGSVEVIQSNAFMDCDSLKNISIPYIKYIGDYAFAGCTSLEDIKLQNGVMIANAAFRWCINLRQY